MKTRASVMAITLLLTACGGGSDDAASSNDTPSSPLSAFLGTDDIDYESAEGQAQLIEEQRRNNELVVACMAAEGFDYVPMNPEEMISFSSGDTDDVEWGTKEFVAKYGFGVSTQRWEKRVVGPDLVGYESDQMDEYVDPNQDYLDSLSEAEQLAFNETLYGNDPGYQWDESLTEEENNSAMEEFYSDYVPSGCQNTSNTEQTKMNEFYAEFGDEMESIWESVQADPRLVAKQDEIKACVEEKGLTYVGEDDVYSLWEAQLNEIDSTVIYPGADLTENDYETMSEDELQAIYSQPATMTDEGKALLAEVQQEEIALAVAVDDCGGGWTNLQDLYSELQVEYEQKFIDDNADALAGFRGAGATEGD